uniref:hypothetical protein n=1 Tax=Streptomyces sp. IBSBF 2806 TaxID=2903529 RepID=UPI002FDC0A31
TLEAAEVEAPVELSFPFDDYVLPVFQGRRYRLDTAATTAAPATKAPGATTAVPATRGPGVTTVTATSVADPPALPQGTATG